MKIVIFLLISMTYAHFETSATLRFPQIFPNISPSVDVGGGVYIDTPPHGGVAALLFWIGVGAIFFMGFCEVGFFA